MRYANLSFRVALVATTLGAACSSKSNTQIVVHGDAGGFVGGTDMGGDLASGSATDLAGMSAMDLASTDIAQPPAPTGSNVVPLIVDSGPPAAQYAAVDVPFITLTICAPGDATNCQTIDHVTVDTGSTGLRVLASVLTPTFISALGGVTASSGHPVTECYTYASGYVYGSVKKADLTIGGESAANLSMLVIGDTTYSSVPNACKQSGTAMNTLDTFGSNAIIGVGLFDPDCGSDCNSSAALGQTNPIYYSCATASTCTATTMAPADQVPNPVAKFPVDNNGVLILLPSLPEAGGSNVMGSLVFGIGTQTNNALGSATIYQAGDMNSGGTVTTKFNGGTQSESFFDSGTNSLAFADSAIPECTGDYAGFDCPTATVNLTASILDSSSTAHPVSFRVGNTDTLFSDASITALDDLATPSFGGATLFDWGLPFFFGRRMFTAIDGASTPGGSGPFYAF